MDFKTIQAQLGLTSAEMARRLNVSDGYVADLRVGRRSLSLKLAVKLQAMLPDEPIVQSVVDEKTGAAA